MKRKYRNYEKYYDECDEKEIKELLIGRKVKVTDNDGQTAILKLDNGTKLKVVANEGCGRLRKRLVFNQQIK